VDVPKRGVRRRRTGMKLTLKTVAGKQFQVEAEAEEKVAQIKQKVQDVQGDALPKERQVLIFQGKILKDDTTLADNGVTENGFLVVMANKVGAQSDGNRGRSSI